MIYEEMLKRREDEISFLELKDDREIEVNGDIYKGYLPLPIRLNTIIDTIASGDGEEIPLDNVIDGIVFLFGLNLNTDYSDVYMDLLNSYSRDSKKLIFSIAMRFFQQEEYSDAVVYLNALINMGFEDEIVYFNLGNTLENLDISELSDEQKNQYVIEIMNMYEKSSNYDGEFSLPYYKLGYIYNQFGQYVKSKITWEKFLHLDVDEVRLQEIRDVIEEMNPSYLNEAAMSYMQHGDYSTALNYLLQINEGARTDRTYFNMSVCFFNLEDMEGSFEAIEKAIEISPEKEYYNQLAINYNAIGQTTKAIDILEETIDEHGEDYFIDYNLASLLFQEQRYNKALVYFEKANAISPNEELEEIIRSLEANYIN